MDGNRKINRKRYHRVVVIAGLLSFLLLTMTACEGEQKQQKKESTGNTDVTPTETVQATDAPVVNIPDQRR